MDLRDARPHVIDTGPRQRLAAIFAADAVGYSRLMAADEAATVAALDESRTLLRTRIETHGGRVVDMAGDSVLAVFDTASGAVGAALDVQRDLGTRNAVLPMDRRMQFRIGVHVGEVIEKADGSVYGDGVNIAARLEGLAEPGGVTVSQAVEAAVRQRVAAVFEDQGEQQVKNIVSPVRAFRVYASVPGHAEAQTPGSMGRSHARSRFELWSSTRKPRWAAALGLSVILIAGTGWAWWSKRSASDAAPVAAPLSIAVIAFGAASGLPVDAQLADELTRSLVTTLGQWRMARTPAHAVSSAAQGGPIDLKALGRELQVRYLVSGDVQRGGDNTTLNARVVDVASGRPVWSEVLSVEASAKPDPVHVLLARLSRRVRSATVNADMQRVRAQPPPYTPMELVLRGWVAEDREPLGLNGVLAGRKLYDEALRLDADFGPALVERAWSSNHEFEEAIKGDRQRLGLDMEVLAQRALAADRRDPDAWDIHATALGWLGRWDEALGANTTARELDPTNHSYASRRAYFLAAMGRAEEAATLEESLIAMWPPGDSHMSRMLCHADLLLGRYAEARPACERAGALDVWWFDQVFLIVAYTQLGDSAKAAIAREQLMRSQPEFTITRFMEKHRSDNARYLEQMNAHMLPALRKAGVRE
ncbi:MAG: adenylate/guanylate cyclase domain-containing protein [Burkholderiaceae bacterium]